MNPLIILSILGAVGASAKSLAGKVWNDKTGKLILLGVGGYAVYKIAGVAGATADTVKSIIGLPVKFYENLTSGWSERNPSEATKAAFAAIVNTIKVKATALNFNATAYITIANKLETQMRGFNFPGQFAAIEQTLEGCNAEDFKAVWLAFGLRISTGFGQQYQNLTQWLQGDLSESNYNILKNRFKASGLL